MSRDIIQMMEKFVSEIGTRLKVKYGLGSAATSGQIERWNTLTKQYIANGMSREAAGEKAASIVFTDFRTHVYASEADTIAYLLDSISKGSK